MQLISKFCEGFRFVLCVIHIFSKYAWFGRASLKDVNQAKYGLLKEVNFTIAMLKNG